jgi:hypothetical protein
MNMPKRMPTHEERPTKLAVAPPGPFPNWIRESLVRKIQANDGFSRREAERQVNAMAAAFREFSEPRRTMHLPRFYQTGMNVVKASPRPYEYA